MVAVVTNPTGIVRSNLIAWLDFSNPASYPGSGTTVTDLSGAGAHGTINWSGSPTWVSNGQASYLNFATAASTNYISSTVTANYMDCCLVFYPDFNYGPGIAEGLSAGVNSDESIRFQNANGGGAIWQLDDPGNNNAYMYNGGTYYLNGTPTNTNSSLSNGWNILSGTRTNLTQGAFSVPWSYYWGCAYSGRYFQGRLAFIALYGAALTPAQQYQNYANLRGRFGI